MAGIKTANSPLPLSLIENGALAFSGITTDACKL